MKTQAGKIFGGFTMNSWGSPFLKGRWQRDPEAFLFTFEKNPAIFKVSNTDKATYVGGSYGPVFGYFDI
jgi:hypothetical protein